jgi:hypothetical protein
VPYLLFMATQQMVYARFALPLLPFLALISGWAIDRTGGVARSAGWQKALVSLLLAAALGQSVGLVLWHNVLLSRPDTRTLAARWIESNVPDTSRVAVEGNALLSVPFQWGGSRPRNLSVLWLRKPQDAAEVRRGEFDFVVVSSIGYYSWDLVENPRSGAIPNLYGLEGDFNAVYRHLDANAQLVALFQPGLGGTEVPFALDDFYTPFWHLLERERMGPTIRIYRVPGAF